MCLCVCARERERGRVKDKINVCCVPIMLWLPFLLLCAGWYVRQAISLVLAGLLGYLSVPVVQNMLSSQQIMNTSFDKLQIVNSYGHFGRFFCCLCVCMLRSRCR